MQQSDIVKNDYRFIYNSIPFLLEFNNRIIDLVKKTLFTN